MHGVERRKTGQRISRLWAVIIMVIIGALFFCEAPWNPQVRAEETISWSDEEFGKDVASALGKDSNTVTKKDLEEITSVSIDTFILTLEAGSDKYVYDLGAINQEQFKDELEEGEILCVEPWPLYYSDLRT